MATTFDKPAGVPVFPPHADPGGDCVLARLIAASPQRAFQAWPTGFEGGIAHRLDTDTSGALLVADDVAELAALRLAFASGVLRKRYRLRSRGEVPWADNVCELEIGHDARHRGRMVVRRGRDTPHRGRWFSAHTEFRSVGGGLWDVVITTGVTHQIRVHAAFVGLPIVGDRRYGGGPPLDEGPALCLHHVGLSGPGVATTPVVSPLWARG